MKRFKLSGRTWKMILAGGGVVLVLGGIFAAGYFVGDDSAQVSSLRERVSNIHSTLAISQAEIKSAQSEADDLRSQLHAERSMHGETGSPAESTSYNTDFPWGAAGTVGYLTMRPTGLSQEGDSWILTVEAKNESSDPQTPFCGDAGAALGDAAGRTYTGDAVLANDTDNCGDDLQPGLTGHYEAKFTMPTGDKPVVVALYGDYSQQSDAKTWTLPASG